MKPPDVDVLVVGAGPVGALLCALLRAHGVSTLGVEREAAIFAAPRAVAMDDVALRLTGLAHPALSEWLSGHVLRAPLDVRTAPPPHSRGVSRGWCSRIAAAASSFSVLGPFPPHAVEESGGHPDLSFFSQPALEARLRAFAFDEAVGGGSVGGVPRLMVGEVGSLQPLPCALCRAASAATTFATLRPGCSACRVGALVSPKPSAATSSAASLPVPHIAVRARYVVGADGGSSGTRRAISVPFSGSTYPDEPWIVIDVETEDPDIAARWTCFNFIVDAHRPFVHCPLPGSGRRFEFLLNAGESAEEMTTPASIASLLHSIGVDVRVLRIIRATVYTFHARSASAWRVGRVLLAGDAAHCMPPFRGQGMCSGLRDAVNLAWKLAACVACEGRLEGGGGEDADARSGGPFATTQPRRRRSTTPKRGVVPSSTHSPPPALVAVEALEQLLDSYQVERAAHVAAVTRTTLAAGSLIMLRSTTLAFLRNLLFGAGNACPITRPFMKDPFALPKALDSGVFALEGRPPRAVASLAPNWPILVGDGHAALLDAALWELRREQVQRHARTHPYVPWFLLLPPTMDSTAIDTLLSLLPQSSTRDAPPPILVCAILPATGAAARIKAFHKGGGAGGGEPWSRIAHGAVGDLSSRLQMWMAGAVVLLRPDHLVHSVGIGAALERGVKMAVGLGGGAGGMPGSLIETRAGLW